MEMHTRDVKRNMGDLNKLAMASIELGVNFIHFCDFLAGAVCLFYVAVCFMFRYKDSNLHFTI